jgi:adenylate cyclase
VPTDDDYQLLVSWNPDLAAEGPSPASVSAGALLNGEVDRALVDGRTVFVGVTDPSLGDRHLTPVNKAGGSSGVLVHANAHETMAARTYLEPASTWVVVAEVFLVALLVALAVQFLPAWLGALAAVVGATSTLLLGYVAADAGTITSLVYPVAAVALAVPASWAVRYSVEERQQRRVASLFAQYVPPTVAQQLIDDGLVEEATTGRRAVVSVLFCDLRGFTALSARSSPTQVNDMLSLYYEYATAIVLEEEGTIMQYVGDEVYAIFGSPIAQADHASRAVRVGIRLQEEVGRLDGQLLAAGLAPLRFGIGINAGEVVATHAGSSWRRQYTAIGDTVNVGSRLCGQAGPGQVVISDAIRSGAEPMPEVEPLGDRPMKGVDPGFVAWKVVLDHPPSGSADR